MFYTYIYVKIIEIVTFLSINVTNHWDIHNVCEFEFREMYRRSCWMYEDNI